MKRRLAKALLRAARRPEDRERPPVGLRGRILLKLAGLLSVAHPTNPSGNNMSQR